MDEFSVQKYQDQNLKISISHISISKWKKVIHIWVLDGVSSEGIRG